MANPFTAFTRIVSNRPRTTLAILVFITIGLDTGLTSISEQAGNDVFLPDGSEVAEASKTLSAESPDSAGLSNVTILHRGDACTPQGLTQIDEVMAAAITIPEVDERLALTEPTVSVAAIYKQALNISTFEGATKRRLTALPTPSPPLNKQCLHQCS